MDIIKSEFILEPGFGGVDEDEDNPLWRASKVLLKDGKPQRALSLCFFDPEACVHPSPWRWFGAFVLSAGGRIIFFPGFSSQHKQCTVKPPGRNAEDHQFVVDHVTLEKNLVRSHITGARPNKKYNGQIGSFRTKSAGRGRVLWFGMSIQSFDALRVVKGKTVFMVAVPQTDSKRRADEMRKFREDQEFPCLKLHPDAMSRFQNGFLHLSIFVGPSGCGETDDHELALPYNSPWIKPELPDRLEEVPLRSHKLSLKPEFDLQIVTSWLPGRVLVPAEFTFV